jgi:NAD(P)-dependent dehydrogenase (short-subunit alcohol dehydrogenase family)
VSKIALTKMTELLDAEIPDTRFVIVGPGWVKTKIHTETLNAGTRAGANYHTTLQRLAHDEFVDMQRVVACCNWVVDAPHAVVGGRNFSVEHDAWGQPALHEALKRDSNLYKLRRSGNDWNVKRTLK